jgi:hypothetical protein
MADTTDDKPNTSADDGKNSDGKEAGADTQAAKEAEAASKKFTQEDLNRIVKDRLKEEAERTKKKADEEAAKAKGEFEKLANGYKAELDSKTAEHTSLQERYDALSEQVAGLIKAELKLLPENIRELKPSDDPLQILEWLPKAKKAAGTTTAKPGNAGDPPPSGASKQNSSDAERQLRQRGGYGL